MIFSAAGAALGGLLFGFDTAVISGATSALQQQFVLSDSVLGFTVASALIGTVIGSLIAGAPADRFGRKPMLLVIAIAYVVSSLGSGLAPTWVLLLAFRFLGGTGHRCGVRRDANLHRRGVPDRIPRPARGP